MGIEIGRVIAVREFRVRKGANSTTTILVSLGEPRAEKESSYICPFSVEGLEGGIQRMYAAGIDGIQALQLAQVMIHAHLTTSREFREGRLYWLRPNNPNGIGFPGSAWEATGLTKPKLGRSGVQKRKTGSSSSRQRKRRRRR